MKRFNRYTHIKISGRRPGPVKIILPLLLSLLIISCASGPDREAGEASKKTEEPGVSIRETLLYNEDFSDKSSNWPEYDNSKVFSTIENGQLIFEHRRESGPWCIWDNAELPESGTTIIEAEITKLSGQENGVYGLSWGFGENSEGFTFLISANGYYSHGTWLNGSPQKGSEWIQNSYINRDDAANLIAVKQRGDVLELFINRHYIGEIPFSGITGGNTGIQLLGNLKVAVNRLTVTAAEESITAADETDYAVAPGPDQMTDYTLELHPVNDHEYLFDEHYLADRFYALGTILRDNGSSQQAARRFLQAIKMEDKAQDPRKEWTGSTANRAGLTFAALKDYESALPLYRRALAIGKELSDPKAVCYRAHNAGVALRDLGSIDEALDLFTESRDAARVINSEKDEAIELHYMAQCCMDLVRAEEAETHLNSALAIFRRLEDSGRAAAVLNDLGKARILLTRYSEAEEPLQEALAINRELDRKGSQAWDLSLLADIRTASGDEASARELLKEAVDLAERGGQWYDHVEHYKKLLKIDRKSASSDTVAHDLKGIGWVLLDNDQYNEALPYYEEALPMFRDGKNQSELANILANLAAIRSWKGEDLKAIEHYREGIAIMEGLESKDALAISYRNMGDCFRVLNRTNEAMAAYQKALALDEELENQGRLAWDIQNIGTLLWARGKYEEAVEKYRHALQLNRDLERNEDILEMLTRLGRLYSDMGLSSTALDFHREALVLAQQISDESEIAGVMADLGSAYRNAGKYDTAMDYFHKALAMAEAAGDEQSVSDTLSSIGIVYQKWGKYDKALEYHFRALEIDKTRNSPGNIAMDYNNLGVVYSSLNDEKKAVDYFTLALEQMERRGKQHDLPLFLNNLGYWMAQKGKLETAEEFFRKSLTICKETGIRDQEAFALGLLGLVEEKRDNNAEALEYHIAALKINREIGALPDEAAVLNNIGVCYFRISKLDAALKSFRQSLEIKDKLRITAKGTLRRDYLSSTMNTYQWLTAALVRTGDFAAAFDSIENSAALYLREQIGAEEDRRAADFSGIDQLRKTLDNSTVVISFANTGWKNSVRIAADNRNISGARTNSSDFISQVNALHQNEIAALYDSLRGVKVSHEQQEESSDNSSLEDLEKIVTYYRKLLTSPGESAEQKRKREFIASRLYTFLFGDIEQQIADKDNLIIRPDGILAFLPFETLIMPDGHYMAEKYTIRYTQSFALSELTSSRIYPDSRKPLIAFGGAVYENSGTGESAIGSSGELSGFISGTLDTIARGESTRGAFDHLGLSQWQNLPGSLKEVQQIGKIIPGSVTVTGKKVSEATLKSDSASGELKRYRNLHFAVHGLVVPEVPELSALVLSLAAPDKDGKENGEDGYLTMKEISELNLEADFVNLSACETGLGKIYGGEGVVGLTQAFLVAGANSLSVSLWQVADESTVRFMSSMYSRAAENGEDWGRAAAQTKREFIQNGGAYTHPFYWAPFVYYGK